MLIQRALRREIEDSYLIPSQAQFAPRRQKGFRGYTYQAVDLTSFNKVLSGVSVVWDVNKTVATLPQASNNAGSANTQVAWTFGTTTGSYINQVARGLLTIAASGTNHFNMSTLSIPNVIGTASPTFSKVKEILVELLAPTQLTDAGVAGTACSSIALGNDAGQKWAAPFTTTGVYTLNNGDKWHHVASEAGGLTVTAGDLFAIVNNDGAVAANVRITILGLA